MSDTEPDNVADKTVNRHKAPGTLRDLMRVRTVGHRLSRPKADDVWGALLAGVKAAGLSWPA